jgi:hypothetical protein
MRVAICQVDGKWPNLALAKLAAWHRQRGDYVERFMPLRTYNQVYASKTFGDTPDDPYVPAFAEFGGTGYSDYLTQVLPDEVEATRPDFSLWPDWHKSMGFTTRGCVRHCPFCVVPQKEGAFRVVAEFGDVWDGKSREVVFLDNTVTAAPFEHLESIVFDASRSGVKIDFCQGFDARLWTADHTALVADYRVFPRRLHFAFDSLAMEPHVHALLQRWHARNLHPDRLTFYVLVGFDTTPAEDMYRVELIRSLGCNPFVMPFNRRDPYQRRLARWVNNKVAFKAMSWEQWQATFRVPLPGFTS